MTTNEIREQFLKYFESKGHTRVASSSLVPAGDPTLLFSNSGMVQFKDCFLGADKRAYSRATTSQKCLRISGKHNDLENVGRTARHHTFFEMLGNFSFGDYFKEDAIKYAWEFLTETIGLPKERLWVTIFETDDEAEKLWKKSTDVLPGRILRCGEKDNFWAMGDTGPCGPCSEIHYYLGDDLKNQSEEGFRKDDGTYMEIWNLVFMQYNRDTSGTLTPLPKPSVDTGMGLERIAIVKQGKLANYDGDLLRGIVAFVEKLSGKTYVGADYTERNIEEDKQYAVDVACRVVTDHARAASFLIADGINPSSDGRGYVLRRLIRRACRHGRNLGFKQAFLYKVCEEVCKLMCGAYPELKENQAKISKLIKAEEEKFLVTLETGVGILQKEVSRLKESGAKELAGNIAFSLHDTYGFPLDMTEDMVRVHGLSVDIKGFEKQMEEQRERSRSSRSNETALILQRAVKATPSKFLGYDFLEYESEVAGLFNQDGQVKIAKEGDEIALVATDTPFYAESGGQVGDTGRISSNSCTLDVIDTQKAGGDTIVHICKVLEGQIELRTKIRLEVSKSRRNQLRAHHSATHLLHQALKEVLGDHIKQAGSRVSETSFRFDFPHFSAVTSEEISQIEQRVNQLVRDNYEVLTDILPIETAKKSGAIALFGEKYGDVVRVVEIGSGSREFCGGTHVKRSGDIGFMQVVSETSVAAGVRRIEAVAGSVAENLAVSKRQLLSSISEIVRTTEEDLQDRISQLVKRNRELEKQLSEASQQSNLARGSELSSQAKESASGTKVVASVVDSADPKQLREMADDLKNKLGSGCIALASVSEGKAIILTAVTDDLTGKYHAGNLLKELSKVVGGKGGGRADLAQAGGGDPAKINEALEAFQKLVS